MKRACLVLSLVLGLAGSSLAEARLVMIRVEQQPSPYGLSRIYDKLALALTRQNGVEVAQAAATHPMGPEFPRNFLDVSQVAAWGQMHDARFVMLVSIQSERLERRKTVNFPLLFQKYETIGVLEGELRLIDVATTKLVRAEPFKVELVGPRIFQASMDDNIGDPDLHLTAPQKVQFFGRLEDKLVEWILAQVKGPLGRYEREYVSRPQGKK